MRNLIQPIVGRSVSRDVHGATAAMEGILVGVVEGGRATRSLVRLPAIKKSRAGAVVSGGERFHLGIPFMEAFKLR
mgnify:CR=1